MHHQEPDSKSIKRWITAAPAIFAVHFLEEAPGFVDWINSRVDPDISNPYFLSINFFVFIITTVVAIIARNSTTTLSASVCTLWLGFMMLANGVLHMAAGIMEAAYVPGLVTATLLYIPYYFLLMRQFIIKKLLTTGITIFLTLIGSIPMLIQGYNVFFLGSRLW